MSYTLLLRAQGLDRVKVCGAFCRINSEEQSDAGGNQNNSQHEHRIHHECKAYNISDQVGDQKPCNNADDSAGKGKNRSFCQELGKN